MESNETKLRKVIRQSRLHEIDGLGRTQRDALIRKGEYPSPIRAAHGGRAKFWLVDELVEWQERRIATGRILKAEQADTARMTKAGGSRR